jgi:hypothetical protein
VKHRQILAACLALAVAALVAPATAAGGSGGTNLDLTGTVTGSGVSLDAKPAGPSPGDVGYEVGLVYDHGKRVGRFQGVCTTLPRASQQCSFTLGLAGGQLVIEAGYGPGFNTGSTALEAIVGGTGAYAGAHGQARDRELGNTRLAFRLELTR